MMTVLLRALHRKYTGHRPGLHVCADTGLLFVDMESIAIVFKIPGGGM